MRKLILVSVLLTQGMWAQSRIFGPVVVRTFVGVPSGSCSAAQLAVNVSTGLLYDCFAGVWTLVGGGSGGSFLPLAGGTLTGNLLFTDNLYDIGASGATRPRNLYLSSNITLGGNLSIGTSPPSSSVCASGTSMMLCGLEGTTPTGTFSAVGILWPNSATHRWNMINNAGSSVQIVGAGVDINTSDQVTGTNGAVIGNSLNPAATNGSGQFVQSTVGSIFYAGCGGAITNLGTVVMFGFQFAAQTCTSTTAFQGLGIRAATVKNLRAYVVSTPSSTPGSGVLSIYKNGSAQAVTCTLGTSTSCSDLTHSFSTAANDQITVKVISAGGTLTAGPSWSSGGTSCTNGTQNVTFSNNTSGVAPANATGTITVSGNVPTGAVTITSGGAGYTAATPPTAGQVATCTGASTFTGGTVTVDALSGVAVSFEVF